MKKRLLGILLTLCLALSLLPTSALAAEGTLIDGWYYLSCMGNYLNLTADGKAELRKLSENEAFYVAHTGGDNVTLRMKDGRYLGLDGARENGARVVAVSQPYVWRLYWQKKSEFYSLRPPEAHSMVLNASGEKNADGTPIIIYTSRVTYGAPPAPYNAELRFIPVTPIADPTGESYYIYKENGLEGYKDYLGNVVIPAQFASANYFSQGIALVRCPDKSLYGFINTQGTLITPQKYAGLYTSTTVSEGLISVAVYNDTVTAALMAGDHIRESVSQNGITTFYMTSGRQFTGADTRLKYGFMNTKGEEVIKPQFDGANDFHEGLAAVYQFQHVINGEPYNKVGWINTAGQLAIPYRSDGFFWYLDDAHDFKDGLVFCFKGHKDDMFAWPEVSIMDKTGKIIYSSGKDEFFPEWEMPNWKDGVIVAAPFTRANAMGEADPSSSEWWSIMALYDYAGNLLVKPKGYAYGEAMGGGYTLAGFARPKDKTGAIENVPVTWSIFDRNGNLVVDRVAGNGYLKGIDKITYESSYENGYLYFGDNYYKAEDMSAIAPKPDAAATTGRHPFRDVKAGAYYEEAVIWAKETGVTGGTSATTFSPDTTCTRGQVVTFLWRAKGSPQPKSSSNPFVDVKPDDYFYKAVLWAAEQGITGGTSPTTFNPNTNCTSAQVLTFLWRSNGSPDSSGMDSPYYAKAVSWAAETHLLDNMGEFSADKLSPRADIVTYLYRNAKQESL